MLQPHTELGMSRMSWLLPWSWLGSHSVLLALAASEGCG